MKDHYFLYALILLVAILGVMMAGAVVYIGVLHAENKVLTEENQGLKRTVDEIDDEIRILSDRIGEITRDVNNSEDWNKETH